MKWSCLTAVLVVTLGMSAFGCASIVSGTKQEIMIDSEPSGATVVVAVRKKGQLLDQRDAGETPITVEVKRKDGVVLVSKEGYETQEVPLVTKMNPWVWGDIALTSPLSTSIDYSTGAAKQYKPGEYLVTLEPADQ